MEGGNGKGPLAQTPLIQKHPFSSKNKHPSQDLHEWATSVGRGSSNQGQDVPLRTHLRWAQVQRLEYTDPPTPVNCPALLSHPQPVLPLPRGARLREVFKLVQMLRLAGLFAERQNHQDLGQKEAFVWITDHFIHVGIPLAFPSLWPEFTRSHLEFSNDN